MIFVSLALHFMQNNKTNNHLSGAIKAATLRGKVKAATCLELRHTLGTQLTFSEALAAPDAPHQSREFP